MRKCFGKMSCVGSGFGSDIRLNFGFWLLDFGLWYPPQGGQKHLASPIARKKGGGFTPPSVRKSSRPPLLRPPAKFVRAAALPPSQGSPPLSPTRAIQKLGGIDVSPPREIVEGGSDSVRRTRKKGLRPTSSPYALKSTAAGDIGSRWRQ